MTESSILEHVALCYSLLINRDRGVMATRLSVFPVGASSPLDVCQLLDAVAQVWPADGGKVALNVQSETLLRDLVTALPNKNVMIEVPSFMANDPEHSQALQTLHAHGNILLLKGRPAHRLPRELLRCFSYSIIDLAEDRRINEIDDVTYATAQRRIPVVQAGVRSMAELEASFGRGVAAVAGWPIEDAMSNSVAQNTSRANMHVIVELMQRVDREESADQMEQTLRRDPTLAFKLLRYLNSPAFGMRVEIKSFSHALMLLGYQRLKSWLALLLVTAYKDTDMEPVMFAAVRRGLFMEELARAVGDEEIRSEMFICGVFSLLDRMFGQPFSELLKKVPVPERVVQALGNDSGPYYFYLELVRAVENESPFEFSDAAERLLLSPGEINRAQLRALSSALELH